MKRIFTLLLSLCLIFSGKVFSQAGDSCIILGCAGNFGTQVTNNTLALLPGGYPGSCYAGGLYSQIFWQFVFVDPLGGPTQDYAQTFGATGGAVPLDIDWSVFDMGNIAPPTLTCPLDQTGWTEVRCSGANNFGTPSGPGIDGAPLTLVAGEYYAIAIIINNYVGADPTGDPAFPNFSFTVGTPTLAGLPLSAANCALIVLPVKLNSFNARVNNCIVNLDWTAGVESGFQDYEVQYSTNGSSFQTLSTLQANPLSKQYSFTHSTPAQGKLYYRLKMKDLDGNFDYSRTIAMNLNCNKSEIVVYPNPVRDKLNVNITNAQNNITTANLFDNNGKMVYKGIMVSGTNMIDMTNFAKGVYMLTLKNSTDVQNIKIIK
ncbi:MAG TPA: T9SS type A sorting domain-containing protein [Chitinophagaceae bacterium]|nr:T9SS type A sorting domain-containing protein [Chitinophagaceae bacterium]